MSCFLNTLNETRNSTSLLWDNFFPSTFKGCCSPLKKKVKKGKFGQNFFLFLFHLLFPSMHIRHNHHGKWKLCFSFCLLFCTYVSFCFYITYVSSPFCSSFCLYLLDSNYVSVFPLSLCHYSLSYFLYLLESFFLDFSNFSVQLFRLKIKCTEPNGGRRTGIKSDCKVHKKWIKILRTFISNEAYF